jgi:uncharacterized membrane protein
MNGNQPAIQKQNNNSLNRQVSVQLESFSGPLPPPQVLSDYERIVPGSAAKILNMAVGQSEHRKSLEAKVIDSNITNSRLGLYFGLVIGLVGIIAGTYLGLYDKQIAGGVIGGGSLVSLVGVFIYGSQQRQKERSGREKELQKK